MRVHLDRFGTAPDGQLFSGVRGAKPTLPAAHPRKLMAREGNRGTALSPARPAHTPGAGSSDKPLPDRNPAYDSPSLAGEQRQRRPPRSRPEPVDNKEVFVRRAFVVRQVTAPVSAEWEVVCASA